MARSFASASSQYVSLATDLYAGAASFSISVWLNATTLTDSVVSGLSGNIGTDFIGIRLNSSGTLSMQYESITQLASASAASTISTGSWHHVLGMVTSSGSDRTVYIFLDGASVVTDTEIGIGGLSIDSTDIGANVTNAGEYFDGDIGEVVYRDINIVGGDVTALANGFPPEDVSPNRILAYWRLLDDDGDMDYWGGNADLTAGGAPTYSTSHPPVMENLFSPSGFGLSNPSNPSAWEYGPNGSGTKGSYSIIELGP